MRAVLTYHSVDDSGSPISIDRASFERHLDWLASGVVRVLPLAELVAEPTGLDAVALTFDDGFANLGDGPLDGLSARRLPATVFVVSDHVGRTNAWGGRDAPGIPTLPLLGWDALGKAAERGVEIGAHTRSHPRLTRIPIGAVDDELEGCAARIERELGVRPTAFAYPYGDLNDPVVRHASRFYRLAVTTEHRAFDRPVDPARVPRLDVYYFRRKGALERWPTVAFRRSVRLRGLARRFRAGVQGFWGLG
ncbi:MAG: polysaccharide deacetylase family protein [Gemmatimonadetes bacterium]|nr:polysaccharide deacetylase family protein [Gemmatimonadota bacterium]